MRRWLGGVGHGVALVFRGFRFWGSRPKLMLLGALPALIVGACMFAIFLVVVSNSMVIADWLTPFADSWDTSWSSLVRIFAAAAITLGLGAMLVLTFTALTLAVGGPIYERIAAEVDESLGGVPAKGAESGLRQLGSGIADGIRLVATAIGVGLLVFLIGLIPVVGGVLGAVTGAVLGGRMIAIELTGTAFSARGLRLSARTKLLGAARPVALGFGMTCYVLFLIPGGAVFATPAATAGATLMAREVLGESAT